MGHEEQLLAIKIANTLQNAQAAEEAYVRIVERSSAEALDDPENYDLHDQEEILEHYIKEAFRECRMLAERMHMPSMASDIRNVLKSYGHNLVSTRPIPGDIIQYCPSLAEISQIYQSMAAMVLGGAVTGLNVLETILRNTAKIIARSKILPDHENDIRNEVLEILKLAFVDARREGQIAKSFKVYHPDIVVPGLMAAVEYKFLRKAGDVKNHLDGVFADMRGYGGHSDRKNFYAIFYQAGPFYTQEDIIEFFHQTGTATNWTPIVLNGPAMP